MFKNATMARYLSGPTEYTDIESKAGLAPFAHCGPTQPKSIGWVPPREKNSALVEAVAGQLILAAKIETRTVPASAIDKLVDAMAAAQEVEIGRKPGKKQRREMKDAALLELMPQAFPKASLVRVWIDQEKALVVMDTASAGHADDVLSLMAQSLGTMAAGVATRISPSSVLSAWLHDGAPNIPNFVLGDECELKAVDGTKATVRYTHAEIATEEVQAHIKYGKRASQVAVEWKDRISFVLTDQLVLRKIDLLTATTSKAESADSFDADVAILTGELAPLLSNLILAMGGYSEAEGKPADGATQAVQTPEPPPHSEADGADPLYQDAVKIVRTQQKASISLVQRLLRISYNRAARMLEEMARLGVVSQMDTSGCRTVLSQ